MSGSDARRGFRYQDLYLLSRLLPHVRDILRTVWRTGGHEVFAALDQSPLRFGIEAKASDPPAHSGDPVWDLTISDGIEDEIIEAKSGKIQRGERVVLWERLRKTAASPARQGGNIVPVLVVDPDAESIEKWQGLAGAAAAFDGSVPRAQPSAPVRSAAQLLQEGLFALCGPSATPTISLPAALALLTHFRVYPQGRAALQEEVEKKLATLFPDAPASVLAGHLRDWLDRRATMVDETSKRFGVSAPLREISLLCEAAALNRGTWRRWLDLRNEWRRIVQSKATGRLGVDGGTIAIADIQPAIAGELPAGQGGKLLTGSGGAGKTTLLVIVDQNWSGHGDSWLVPAANLSELEIDELAAAVRFAAALTSSDEHVRVAVDALDEVDSGLRRERWGVVLARLAAHQAVEVIAAVRNADFERDSHLRIHLESWKKFNLKDWPEDVVRQLLVPTSYEPHLKPGLLSLLCTPILLDLFWRTFIEAQPSAAVPRLPMTRHQLLSTFWSDRLIRNPRHIGLSNKPSCFDPIFTAAARNLDGFKEDSLDNEALRVLASEAVLVNVGRLRPQWQFRHPLLRDFALAQWCLASDSTDEVALRWESIDGAIPRQGALQAILEALIDDSAPQDYPKIRFQALTEIFLFRSDESRSAFIRSVAALPALSILDPAAWAPTIQHRLPPNFGGELVGATRRETNLSWAVQFANWPQTAEWLDESFVPEVNSYLRLFLAGRREPTKLVPAVLDGAHLARSVRRWSESTRFRGAFERDGRFQKHFAVESIAALLPERETLAWLAREVPHATWLTQIAILENLRLVAHTDPKAAADVYRAVVGLYATDDRWTLDEKLWGRDISHNAFDLSLTGPNVNLSLLSSFPEDFLPVAMEMAEAIHWRDEKHREQNDQELAYLVALRGHSSALQEETTANDRPDPLGDLIDDISSWHFESRTSPCQEASRKTVEEEAERSANTFATRLAPILRRSRLASVQGIVLETATKHNKNAAAQSVLRECLTDARLFHAPGLLPALEGAIAATWYNLDTEGQARLMSNIEATAPSHSHYRGPFARRMLLAAVPEATLNAEQQVEANAYREQQLQRVRRELSTEKLSEEFPGWQRDEHSKRIAAEWPDSIDRDKLEEFHILYSALQGPSPSDAKNTAIRAQELMFELFPSLTVDPRAWDNENATWMWHALRDLLQTLRTPINARSAESETLLHGAVELALQRLELGRAPTTQNGTDARVMSSSDSAWLGALAVANEALVHPELIDSAPFANRFGETVIARWNEASPAEQVDILYHVRFVKHWTRPGPLHTFAKGRLWTDSIDARPLAAALSFVPNLHELDRDSVLRMALKRTGLPHAEKLARDLGRLLGEYSMVVDQHGQRLGLVTLSNECVTNPENFPFLSDYETQRVFLSQFAFGMKTQAKHYADHFELASDFGRWNLAAWRHLHLLPPANDYNTISVSLFALHWLSEGEEVAHSLVTRLRWWQELGPLRQAILQEGGARDLSHFYFLFYQGKLLDLCGTAEIFASLESLLLRLEPLLLANLITLEQTSTDDPDPRYWREALDRAVDAIDYFRRTGALDPPNNAETAHRLLSRLSAQPFNNAAAKDALHRLVS
jgi:hypothetical protein